MASTSQFESPLRAADAAFRLLTRGPEPLSVNGAKLGDPFPRRLIPLDELRTILLRRSTGPAARDTAWREVGGCARGEDPQWVIGAVGVAMPALRRAAGTLSRGYTGDTADIDAEVLTGFLAALRSIDLSRPAIALRLRWAAYRAGAAFRSSDARWSTWEETDSTGTPVPARPEGHPDLVLAAAVDRGVISAADAELIGLTRLESVPLTIVARYLSVPYDAARMRRSRAEERLVSAIREGHLS